MSLSQLGLTFLFLNGCNFGTTHWCVTAPVKAEYEACGEIWSNGIWTTMKCYSDFHHSITFMAGEFKGVRKPAEELCQK